MTLPYDYSRCAGATNWRTKAPGEPERIEQQCNDCRRREPGHPERQVYLAPLDAARDGLCMHYIGPVKERE